MPVTAIKNLAKKHGMDVASAEKKWDEAKSIVNKEYKKDSPAYWGTVMKIAKAKIKKHGKKSKKESRIYDFETFVNESRKEKLEINKEIKKIKREEQLKSGADLTTRVVPDKKKVYKRIKKINIQEED